MKSKMRKERVCEKNTAGTQCVCVCVCVWTAAFPEFGSSIQTGVYSALPQQQTEYERIMEHTHKANTQTRAQNTVTLALHLKNKTVSSGKNYFCWIMFLN